MPDACGVCDGPGYTTYCEDFDGDGLGHNQTYILSCSDSPPEGFVLDCSDCNNDAEGNGIAEGACDCDGNVDLGCGCGVDGPTYYYEDADADGFGDSDVSFYGCGSEIPTGYVADSTDFDDDAPCDTNEYDACYDYWLGQGTAEFSCVEDGGNANTTTCADDSGNEVACSTDLFGACDCGGGVWDVCGNCAGPGLISLCEDHDGDGLGDPITLTQVCDPAEFEDYYVADCTDEDDTVSCPDNFHDCGGVLCGGAEIDACGVCNAYETQPDFPYGTCDCNGNHVDGEDGTPSTGDEYLLDSCGVCDIDTTNDDQPDTGTCDCNTVPGGGASLDACGVCDGNSENDCVESCPPNVTECDTYDGTWIDGACFGGTAVDDGCGACDNM
jgi:hypothetical protein